MNNAEDVARDALARAAAAYTAAAAAYTAARAARYSAMLREKDNE